MKTKPILKLLHLERIYTVWERTEKVQCMYAAADLGW